MPAADTAEPAHLIVQQSVFGGEHFWAALNRLADRRGHHGHDRYLGGATQPTNQYAFHCMTCSQVVATMVVERERRS